MPRLADFIAELESDGATGRVTVRVGRLRGWVYLADGLVYCAERDDRPTLLVALADAGLFDRDSWAASLRAAPGRARWDSLVPADRRPVVNRFVRKYVADVLDSLDAMGGTELTFGAAIGHPFGAAAKWSVKELLGPRRIEDDVDSAELHELLLETSPLVRLVDAPAD